MSARRAVAAAAVLLASAGLSGCSSPARVGPLPGVVIRVLQYRSDIAPHQVQLQVVNGSKRPIVVDEAALRGSGWSPALRWRDDDPAEIGAGTAVDLPVPLTTASCGTTTTLGGLLRLADGTTRSVRAVDVHGTLAALHRQDCFAETAARAATAVFSGFRPRGRTAEVVLTVHGGPEASTGATVERVLPTPLLSPRDGAATWTVERRFTGSGSVALTAVPTRCDLHAIAEDKVGTVLPVQLRLADGTTGTVDAVAPAALRNRVLAWVVDACRTS